MDTTDRELLRLLSLDARRSAAELARELNVSRVTVQNRIDRLKANGTIRRFTVELGVSRENVLVEALVLLKLAPGDSRKTITQLKRIPELQSLGSINGTFDLVLELRTSSHQRLDTVLRDIRRMPMVAETNSSIRLNHFY
ncbi:Lrp/AsnC family transcriptional regulator [Ruegeria sp.]|uniref:Lrp/AsnC family transcriptional regulator n=1 Tax=Ruegeria sp. TaxID=1879320 RepID=UPI003B5B32D6